MKTIKLMATAMSVLALGASPLAANAQELPWPEYQQAMGCTGYYSVLHFYSNNSDPKSKDTAKFKKYAADWLKLAALLRKPADDLEQDYEDAQQEGNELIKSDARASELAEVQTYCRANGVARFKWDQ